MSDSITKYWELVEEGKINPDELGKVQHKLKIRDGIDLDIVELISTASRAGLLVEVLETAMNEVRQHGKHLSNKGALQIAIDEWDL